MPENIEAVETNVTEVNVAGKSKLDTATTIFCVGGSCVAFGGLVKKGVKKVAGWIKNRKAKKAEFVEAEEFED